MYQAYMIANALLKLSARAYTWPVLFEQSPDGSPVGARPPLNVCRQLWSPRGIQQDLTYLVFPSASTAGNGTQPFATYRCGLYFKYSWPILVSGTVSGKPTISSCGRTARGKIDPPTTSPTAERIAKPRVQRVMLTTERRGLGLEVGGPLRKSPSSALTYSWYEFKTEFSMETDLVFPLSHPLVRSGREYSTMLSYGKGSARSLADGSGYHGPGYYRHDVSLRKQRLPYADL